MEIKNLYRYQRAIKISKSIFSQKFLSQNHHFFKKTPKNFIPYVFLSNLVVQWIRAGIWDVINFT